jgi:hypothetical protein
LTVANGESERWFGDRFLFVGFVDIASLPRTRFVFHQWRFAGFSGHDIAGLGLVIEVQLGATRLELPQHTLDTTLDRRMVGAVASDKFQDNRSKRRRDQYRVGDAHRKSLAEFPKLLKGC